MDIARLALDVDTRKLKAGERELTDFRNTANRTAADIDKGAAVMNAAFARVGAAIASGFAVTEFVRLADTFTRMNAQLRLVTDSAAELAGVERQLFEISQANRVGFESTVQLYARIARSTDTLGVSQEQVLRVTDTINKALVISGTSAQEASGALMQLGQAFASGTLRGDELNSILEGMPRVAQAIAEGMGVTVGQLRALGAQGELTSEQVFNALLKMSQGIDQEFGKMPATVGQAFTVISNSTLRMVGVFDQANNISGTFAESIMGVSRAMDAAGGSVRTVVDIVFALGGGFLAYRGVLLSVTVAQAAYTSAMIISTRAIGAAQAGTLGLNAALLANPFTAVAAAVGVLAAAFIGLANSQAAAKAETNNLITSLKAAAAARSADFASQRAALQYRLNVLETPQPESIGDRLTRFAGGGFVVDAADNERAKEAIRLRRELTAVDKSYAEANKATQAIAVPAGQSAGAIAGAGRAASVAAGQARQATDAFGDLYEALFPESITRRQREQLNLIDQLAPRLQQMGITREQARRRALGLDGDATVSSDLLNTGPLDTSNVTNAAEDIVSQVAKMRNATANDTVTIADSFAQMSQRIVGSLQGLANSLRSGDILGILGGVLNIFTQLGSAGVFGAGLQGRLNASTAGPSFDGGGYTGSGSRSGGMDGKGGFLAMLHPNETVIDHHRGQRMPANDTTVRVMVGVDPRNGSIQPYVTGQIAETAPQIAGAGAAIAQAQMAERGRRRYR